MLWLVLSRSGFCSTDRFHGNGPIPVFLFWSKAGKFNICNQDSEKKCEDWYSSHWNYQQKLKRLKFFRNSKEGWRGRSFFKSKPPEVHFTIRNRVPYNKLLTKRACLGRNAEYWPSVVFVRTSLRSVRTVTTSGQYFPIRPSRSVSKRLIYNVQFMNFCHLVTKEKMEGWRSTFPFLSIIFGAGWLTSWLRWLIKWYKACEKFLLLLMLFRLFKM